MNKAGDPDFFKGTSKKKVNGDLLDETTCPGT